MPSCLTAPVTDEHLPVSAVVSAVLAPRELTERDRESLGAALARVPDPRDPRGARYPIVAMLMVVVAAMAAGARSYAAIGEWCADLDAARRAALGFTGRVPGPVTIWRLLVRIDAVTLDEVVNVWTRAHLERVEEAARARAPDRRPVRRVPAVDGKAMRATLRGTSPMHLLSALDHTRGVVVAQVSVDVKTNEIPLFATLLDQIPDLEGTLPAVDGRPGRGHPERSWSRPDREADSEGRHRGTRPRVPPCSPRHPDRAPVPAHHTGGTGSGPPALAVCRNLLISLLRLSGHTNIASALRHHARHPDQAIALVASEQPTTQ